MRYEIEVGGRTRAVTVTRSGGGFAVEVDGRNFQINAARVDANTLSLMVDNGAAKEAVLPGASNVTIVAGRSNGEFTVQVGGVPVAVSVDGRRRWGRADDAAAAGPQRVTAPMPGKVVRLFVQPGEQVTARQPLVVVEAMKMENELRAGRAGTVAEVHAREGASVEAGALLIVIQ
jgi:biotin carboxyl carrier protein